MFAKVAKAGFLAGLAVVVMVAPAEAFGRRQTTCCQPVYYDCYYPPCPPQPTVHLGWDCVCNKTDKVLRVNISSSHGCFETTLAPGACAAFWFIKDNKPRAISAFTRDNDLVLLTTFTLIDQTGRPRPICYPIRHQPFPLTKEVERTEADAPHGLTPSGQPF